MSAWLHAGKHSAPTDEQLAAVPARMCQQCGWHAATRIKRTLKTGQKRHVCQSCFDKINGPKKC